MNCYNRGCPELSTEEILCNRVRNLETELANAKRALVAHRQADVVRQIENLARANGYIVVSLQLVK